MLGRRDGVGHAGLGPEAAAAQEAQDPIADAMRERAHILVLERRGFVEDGMRERALRRVRAVEDERMEMKIQIQRRTETLLGIDGPGANASETRALALSR